MTLWILLLIGFNRPNEVGVSTIGWPSAGECYGARTRTMKLPHAPKAKAVCVPVREAS